jgi:hypothetical protein
MLVELLAAMPSSANTWVPYEDGFVSRERDDAPTDGWIVYTANYVPRATATDSAGTVVELDGVPLTGAGSEPRVALLPPAGGWGEGETWTLSVLGYAYEDEVASMTFTAGAAAAASPVAATIDTVETAAWSEEQTYDWGCCHPPTP